MERQVIVCMPLHMLFLDALSSAEDTRRPMVIKTHLETLGVFMRARDLLSRARRLLCSKSPHDPARSALAREVAAFLDTSLGGEVPPPEGSVTDAKVSDGVPARSVPQAAAPAGDGGAGAAGAGPGTGGGRTAPRGAGGGKGTRAARRAAGQRAIDASSGPPQPTTGGSR